MSITNDRQLTEDKTLGVCTQGLEKADPKITDPEMELEVMIIN